MPHKANVIMESAMNPTVDFMDMTGYEEASTAAVETNSDISCLDLSSDSDMDISSEVIK
jgi:hypothetical protein